MGIWLHAEKGINSEKRKEIKNRIISNTGNYTLYYGSYSLPYRKYYGIFLYIKFYKGISRGKV